MLDTSWLIFLVSIICYRLFKLRATSAPCTCLCENMTQITQSSQTCDSAQICSTQLQRKPLKFGDPTHITMLSQLQQKQNVKLTHRRAEKIACGLAKLSEILKATHSHSVTCQITDICDITPAHSLQRSQLATRSGVAIDITFLTNSEHTAAALCHPKQARWQPRLDPSPVL